MIFCQKSRFTNMQWCVLKLLSRPGPTWHTHSTIADTNKTLTKESRKVFNGFGIRYALWQTKSQSQILL